MVHDNTSLMVSENEAERVDDEAKRRLLAVKKLSLVVDLDQTIIHATVDPTVGDWQSDENNPNYGAVKDVRSFILKDEGIGRDGIGCWYYIKLRPGLQEFLENVSKLYELHIYTMGTRQYAKNIADIIDPERKIFGDRILSRDESGSMTAKNLQRLFPVDTKMVVIIDDRGDVWKWSPNLIKVTPYDFFVGIGDINSSFLPKKPELRTSVDPSSDGANTEVKVLPETHAELESAQKVNGTTPSEPPVEAAPAVEPAVDLNASPLDQLVAMSGADGSTNIEEQTTIQDEALAVQMEEKPLLQKQKQLEAAEDAAAAADALSTAISSDPSTSEAPKDIERPRHSLLQDNDRELTHLENSLRNVHTAFFRSWDQSRAAAQGGRLGILRGAQKQKSPTSKSDLDLVPDVKVVLPSVKAKVLSGTVLVLSGIVPLGMDIASTDIAILARSFGAFIDTDVHKTTTHVVAARNRTQKVRAAVRRGKGRIKIVSPAWLLDSISAWKRQDETEYLLDTDDGRDSSFVEDDILSESASEPSDGDEEVSDADSSRSSRQRPNLTISVKPRSGRNGTDGDESVLDEEDLLPEEIDADDRSPWGGSNEDWNAMNDELAEFLGSDADENDLEGGNESDASVRSRRSATPRGRKRTRADADDSDTGSERSTHRAGKRRAGGADGLPPTTLSQSSVVVGNGEGGIRGGGNVDGAVEDGTDELFGGDEADGKEGDGWSDFEEEDLDAEIEQAGSEELEARKSELVRAQWDVKGEETAPDVEKG